MVFIHQQIIIIKWKLFSKKNSFSEKNGFMLTYLLFTLLNQYDVNPIWTTDPSLPFVTFLRRTTPKFRSVFWRSFLGVLLTSHRHLNMDQQLVPYISCAKNICLFSRIWKRNIPEKIYSIKFILFRILFFVLCILIFIFQSLKLKLANRER